MRKKITAAALAFVMAFSSLSTLQANAEETGDIRENAQESSVTLTKDHQKLVFTKNGAGQYVMQSFVSADGSQWDALFDGGMPLVSGEEFDLYPTSYQVVANTQAESRLRFSGENQQKGYTWDMEVAAKESSDFFEFTITCHLTNSLTLTGLEPKFALWMNQGSVELSRNQGPDSIYGGNNVGLGFPAAYLYDQGREAVFFLDATPMTWMGHENLNSFQDTRVSVFTEDGKTALGLNVLSKTGDQIPAGDMTTRFYLYTGCLDGKPTGLDAVDRLVRRCAPLHPATAEPVSNRHGDPMTWEAFARNSMDELRKPSSLETWDMDLQDSIVPEAAREGEQFISGKARPNAAGYDFSTTNNWLSAWIGFEQLKENQSDRSFLSQKIDGLASFYDPKANMIRWGQRNQNRVGDVDMSWQTLYFSVETIRTYLMMRDEDFHPAVMANVVSGAQGLTELLQNSDYLLPQWFDPYEKEKHIQSDVPALGYILEPWQVGSYAYILMQAYETTGNVQYRELAKTALDEFFASSYSITNSVYSKTYGDPSEFPITELFGNSYGTVAASMLYEDTGDALYGKYSDYFLDGLLRLTFWYDDEFDDASRTLNNLGLFEPHGGAHNPCPWETIEAYQPVTAVLKTMTDETMTTLLAKLYNLNRINSYQFYPATWDSVFSNTTGYWEENQYMPTEPYYMTAQGGHGDYGALYMASLAPFNYLMYEGFAAVSDQEVMILNLDSFDNFKPAVASAQRSFLLYNPTGGVKNVIVNFLHLPENGSFDYTQMDAGQNAASTEVLSTAELSAKAYQLQPGEIVRIRLENRDDAVLSQVNESSQAKDKLSTAYYAVRLHVQDAYRTVLQRTYPDMGSGTAQTLARYVGVLADYDNAVAHLKAAADRGDTAEQAAEYLMDAYANREACDTPVPSAMEAPAYVTELITGINAANAAFQGGAYSLAAERADAVISLANGHDRLGSVSVNADRATYQVGESGLVTASAVMIVGGAADLANAQIVYTTDDESVVSLNAATGAFTAAGPGRAVITATVTLNGEASAGAFVLEVAKAPELVSAEGVSDQEIALAWQPGEFAVTGVNGYRVYRDGQSIAEVSGEQTEFKDEALTESTTYRYEVTAINPAGFETEKSNAKTAFTLPDTTPPVLSGAYADQGLNTVRVLFDEAVEKASAEEASNYAVSGGVAVEAAARNESNYREVILTVSALAEGQSYTLTVSGISNMATAPSAMTGEQSVVLLCMEGVDSYYKFDEGEGSQAADSNGHSPLMITNARWSEGILGSSLSFDGTGSAKADQTNLTMKDGFTISFWLKTENDRPNQKTILELGEAGQSNYMRLYESFDGQLVMQTAQGGYYGGATQVDTGTWRHAAVVVDGSKIRWYCDGMPSYTWNLPVSQTGGLLPLIVGNTASGNEGFQGQIDELRIYRKPLTDAQVAGMYGTGGPPAQPQGLTLEQATDSAARIAWLKNEDFVKNYRVYRDGQLIAETSDTAFENTGLQSSAQYAYEVSAVGISGQESVKSTALAVTTQADTTPPAVILSASDLKERQISLTFSEPVDEGDAQNLSNYSVSHGVTVSAAALSRNGRTVLLETASALSAGTVYTVTAAGLRDRSANSNPMPATEITVTHGSSIRGQWNFNEAAGDTAADSSGNKRNLTLSGGAAFGAGKTGAALDVTNGGAAANQGGALALDGEFSVSAWIKRPDTAATGNGVVLSSGGDSDGSFKIYVSFDGQIALHAPDASGAQKDFGSAIQVDDNLWHFVNVVYDGTSVTWYIDDALGYQTPNVSLQWKEAAGDLMAGSGSDGTEAFCGLIDDLTIYGRALTEGEAQLLFDSQSGGGTSQARPAFWTFDENAGASAADSTGINGPLALTGSAVFGAGKSGSCLDVSSGGTAVNRWGALSLGSAFSISAWVKRPDTADAGSAVFLSSGGAGSGSFELYVSFDGQAAFHAPDAVGNQKDFGSAVQVDDDRWHLLTVTYDGENLTWYVDGTLGYCTQNVVLNWQPSSGPLTVGAREDGSGAFGGLIDELSVYHYALTESEVSALIPA